MVKDAIFARAAERLALPAAGEKKARKRKPAKAQEKPQKRARRKAAVPPPAPAPFVGVRVHYRGALPGRCVGHVIRYQDANPISSVLVGREFLIISESTDARIIVHR